MEKQGRKIHVVDGILTHATGLNLSRVTDQKGHLERLLVQEALVEPSEPEAIVSC